MTHIASVWAAVVITFASIGAEAALVDIVVEGTWESTSADPVINPMGLVDGDKFLFEATYDDTTLFNGPEGVTATLDPSVNPGTSFKVTIPHAAGAPNPLVFTHDDHTSVGFAPFAEIEFDGADATTDPGSFRNFEIHVDFPFAGGDIDLDIFNVFEPETQLLNVTEVALAARGTGSDHLRIVRNTSVVIGFENAAPGTLIDPPYAEDGFAYGGQFGEAQEIELFGANNVVTDSNPLNFTGAGASLTLTAVPGGTFDLISLDVADLTGNPAGGGGVPGSGSRIEITAGGTVIAVYTPTSSSLSTQTLNLTGLTTLGIGIVSAASGVDDFAVDNLVVAFDAPSPAVPALAPLARWTLVMSLGIGGGLVARRRLERQ